jgi:hypothetical protein
LQHVVVCIISFFSFFWVVHKIQSLIRAFERFIQQRHGQ